MSTATIYPNTLSPFYLTLPPVTSTSASTVTAIWPHPNTGTLGASFYATNPPPSYYPYRQDYDPVIRVRDGDPALIRLPDGTKIDVKADGSFTMLDEDAQVIYRANRVRDFNPFINASDKIEEFVRFCGDQGVRQDEMLRLPLNLFIAWLVVEAARADQEPDPDVPLLADLRERQRPRCTSCGRFMRHALAQKQIAVCSSRCFDKAAA